jgi:hypothetical protein
MLDALRNRWDLKRLLLTNSFFPELIFLMEYVLKQHQVPDPQPLLLAYGVHFSKLIAA